MDFFTTVEKRRSIRKYQDKEVKEEIIKKVIDAGRLAPTGGNMQPWEFIIVKEKANINRITDATFIGFDKESSMKQDWLRNAPALIVVCVDFKRTIARYGEMGRKIALFDNAAAIENMLLAATALELGSCWVSGFDTEELKRVMGIDGQVEPISILPLGYPEYIPGRPNRFSYNEIVHYEQYGNLEF